MFRKEEREVKGIEVPWKKERQKILRKNLEGGKDPEAPTGLNMDTRNLQNDLKERKLKRKLKSIRMKSMRWTIK